jgi:DNA-binding transcriptional LysR family regulator
VTPTQLRAFAAIARHGASKDAATELEVSEAAVSGHVAALRKELGDELFHRTGNGLVLTPGGIRLASRAVEMLGLQDQTRSEVRAAAGGKRILRLAVSSLFGEYAAPGLIELFSTRAEDLEVELSVTPPGDFVRLLITRAIDAAIGPMPSSTPDKIDVEPFLRYQLVPVVGLGHPLAGRRVGARELSHHTWLLGPSAVDADSGAARMLRHYRVAETNQRIYQNHAAALVDARAGEGVANCPAHVLPNEAADGRLVKVQAPGSMVDGTWSTFTLRRDDKGALAKELVRFASTPRATQAMLTGSGANIGRFRPRVHVTLWS